MYTTIYQPSILYENLPPIVFLYLFVGYYCYLISFILPSRPVVKPYISYRVVLLYSILEVYRLIVVL